MPEHAMEDVNCCLNIKITFYFETSDGQSSNSHLNIVYFSTTVLVICGNLKLSISCIFI
jgi:hypothetical protein